MKAHAHRTSKGRVVYTRKTHYFTAKDLVRVASSINLEATQSSSILQIIDSLTKKMLDAILALVGRQGFSEVILGIMKRFVLQVLGQLQDDYRLSDVRRAELRKLYDNWVGLH